MKFYRHRLYFVIKPYAFETFRDNTNKFFLKSKKNNNARLAQVFDRIRKQGGDAVYKKLCIYIREYAAAATADSPPVPRMEY